MSVEYVIENYKTKQFLYCTKIFGDLQPEHLIGDIMTIEHNLLQHLWFPRDSKFPTYRPKYCKWVAHIIVKFVGDAELKDLDIHPDEYFCGAHTNYGPLMYMTETELDNWLKESANE